MIYLVLVPRLIWRCQPTEGTMGIFRTIEKPRGTVAFDDAQLLTLRQSAQGKEQY